MRLIAEAIEDLPALGEVTAMRLQDDRHTRRIVEPCIELLVDAASSINNGHVAATVAGDPPRDLTESFDKAAAVGLLPADLASRLRRSAGMRNAIVHAYVDLDFERVASAVPTAIENYGKYVDAVTTFLSERRRPDGLDDEVAEDST